MKKPILIILFLSFFMLMAIAQKQSFKFTTSDDELKQTAGTSTFLLGSKTKSKGEITISPPVKKVVNKTDKIKVTDTLETNIIVKGEKYIVECGKVYSVLGKFTKLDVSDNQLNSLDVSECTKLKTLYLLENVFSVCGMDSLFLMLPRRMPFAKAKIFISNTSSYYFSNGINNKCRTYIANDKNWKVVNGHGKEKQEIKNSEFACDETANQYFKFKSSGNNFRFSNNTETGGEIRISPPVKNGKLKTNLIEIGSSYKINPNIEYTITSNFTKLDISNMQLTSLILSETINLISFNCSNNELMYLDAESLKRLEFLNCENNKLTSLDLLNSTNLRELHCYNNKFSVCALDSLFLTLPFSSEQDSARIYIANNDLNNGINNKCRTNYLTERKWKAFDLKNDSLSEEIKNTNFACKKIPSFKFISGSLYFKLGKETDNGEGDLIIFPAVKESGVETNLIKIGNSYKVDADTLYTVFGDFRDLDVSNNNLTSLDVSDLTKLNSLICFGNKLISVDVSRLKSLRTLNCQKNHLTSLDVFNLINLKYIYCGENQLKTLDVSSLVNLDIFYCPKNQITSLDVSGLSNLTNLNCANNQISELKVSEFKSLESLDCSNNQIDNLDVSALSRLEELYCSNNQLTSLDVSSLSKLTKLNCANNQIPELKVSELKFLESFDCSNNRLTSLDVSKCVILKEIHCFGNAFSVCALDSLFETLPKNNSKNKAKVYISYMRSNNGIANKCRTYIAKDKKWKVMNYEDSFISFYSSEIFHTEIINAKFNCSETSLQNFKFVSSGTCFKLSKNTESEGYIKIYPPVKKGDVETNIIDVESLYSIDPNTEYTLSSRFLKLDVSSNKLTKLNLAATGSLISLNCQNNELTNLDLLSLTNLKEIYCYNNKFSACALNSLFLTLAFREEKDTAQIYIASNNLENEINNKCHTDYLIEKKWKALNYISDTISLEIKNSEYTCEEVLPMFKFVSSGTEFKLAQNLIPPYSYSKGNDPAVITIFPAVIKKGGKTNIIKIGELYHIDPNTEYTVKGEFALFYESRDINTVRLSISGNQLTSLDVSTMFNLKELQCSDNNLTSLNISGLRSLESLYCSSNELNSLDVSSLEKLSYLNCDKNKLINLDLSNLNNLHSLKCSYNQLTSLNVSGLTKLYTLYCNDNQLININISDLINLGDLDCSSNQLIKLDFSDLKSLYTLKCRNNKITNLNLTRMDDLKIIWCSENDFSVCALDSLFLSLPKKTYTDKRRYLYIGDKSNNSLSYDKCRTYIAKNKNWKVASSLIERKIEREIEYAPVEMINTEFSCEETKEIDVSVKKE